MKIIKETLITKNIDKNYVIEFEGKLYTIYKWHSYHIEHGDSGDIEIYDENKNTDVPDEVQDFAQEIEMY
jgi:hypothetical protein